MASRVIVSVELTLPAKKALDGLSDTKGMTQWALLSRLAEWFAKQPGNIQSAAMSLDPAASKAAAGLIIKIASGK